MPGFDSLGSFVASAGDDATATTTTDTSCDDTPASPSQASTHASHAPVAFDSLGPLIATPADPPANDAPSDNTPEANADVCADDPDDAPASVPATPVKAARPAARPVRAGKARKNAITALLDDLGMAQLPTARTRSVIDRLVAAGSADALAAQRPNLKAMLADLCNWDGKRVTATLVRAAGAALTATRDGAPCYAQAVEMLSFIAACAPMLEPDRLARIVALAPDTPCAYAPITATLHLTDSLERLLEPFDEPRREMLLASLWTTAHDGRWWDATGTKPRRPRGAPHGDDQAHTAAQALELLCAGELAYSADALALLGRATPSPAQAQTLATLARTSRRDPDEAVLIAHVPHLSPDARPASPVLTLVDQLVDLVTDEGGTIVTSVYPARPDLWGELYPEAPVTPFAIPTGVLRVLDGAVIRGADGPVTVVRNAAELARNRDHMGNCTWGYREQCKKGDYVLCQVAYQGQDYNFSILRRAGTWDLGEVNSRFNAGNVPDPLRTAVTRLVGTLP